MSKQNHQFTPYWVVQFSGSTSYRIPLNEPWSGPALLAGMAIRNAAGGPALNEPRIDPPVTTRADASLYAVTIGRNEWQDGDRDEQAFRPGTAFIQPVILATSASTDVVIAREQDAYYAGPLVATFDGQSVATVNQSAEVALADSLFPVDITKDYELGVQAVIGDDLLGNTTGFNTHSLGFVSYDSQGNEIMPPQISRVLLDSFPIPDEWTAFTATVTSFRTGTAYLRPIAIVNENSVAINDTVTLREFTVERIDLTQPHVQVDTNQQISLDLDVLAKGTFEGAATVVIASVEMPVHGTATIQIGAGLGGRDIVNYLSEPWFVGTDLVDYTLRNTANNETFTSSVTIQVLGGNVGQDAALATSLDDQAKLLAGNNVPEVLYDDNAFTSYETFVGQSLEIDGVGSHDLLFSVSDTTDSLTVRLAAGPSHGALRLNHDGTFEYAPIAGYSGVDAFRYEAFDGLHSTTGNVVITVHDAAEQLPLTRLHTLGLGLYNHEAATQRFPIRSTEEYFDSSGNPHLSWRVHLLPYVGFTSLYLQFRLDEPWNSANNLPLVEKMPDLFRSAGDLGTSTTTRFQVISGDGALYYWRRDSGRLVGPKYTDFDDGIEHSILLVESGADKSVTWTRPDDLEFDLSDPLAALGTVSPDGIKALMGEARTITLPANIEPSLFEALVTISGGEIIDFPTLRRQFSEANGGVAVAASIARADEVFYFRKIALAMNNYSSANGRFPVAASANFDGDGNPFLSWRVHLLPYLGY